MEDTAADRAELTTLSLLQRAGLLRGEMEDAFDRFTRLAAGMLRVPVAQMNVITDTHQLTKSCAGPEPWTSTREVPITHSYCRHVLTAGEPLVVADAREHPLVADNPATLESGIVAYAAAPVRVRSGHVLGTLCVVDFVSRDWTASEIGVLRDLAAGLGSEVDLRLEIARREEVEEALAASQQRFHSAFAHAGIGMGLLDLTGRWIAVNRSLCELLGYQEAELLARTFAEVTHPDDLRADRIQMARLLAGAIDRYEMEKRYLRSDGEEVWGLLTRSAVRNVDGQPLYLITQVQDVTAQKRAQQQLQQLNASLEERVRSRTAELMEANARIRAQLAQLKEIARQLEQSEQRYRSLFDYHPDAVYRVDTQGNVVEVNDAATELVGRSREELLGSSFRQVIAPEAAEGAAASFGSAVRGQPQTYDSILMRPDGRRLTVRGIAVPVFVDGATEGVIGVAEDVTERISLEAQLRHAQKMEAVGRLAGGLAHDFNNLLTVIMSHASFLREEIAEGEERMADVEEIEKAVRHAAALTRQLLTFSRQQVMQAQAVDLNEVITDTRRMLERLLGADIQFVVRLEPDLHLVYADPGQLAQVLVNLTVNARDAMPDGGRLEIATGNVRISASDEVDLAPELEDGDYVVLRVADSGVGMDAATLARIFDPFFTTKEVGKGTGLGLSTVFGIVKQSGGTIRVRSEAGRGAAFEVYLPAYRQ